MEVVVAADAGVEPDAVVVCFGDAGLADAAVLAAGGLGEAAGAAVVGVVGWWVEERVVVGVDVEVLGEVGGVDGRGARAGEVNEEVGEGAEDWDEDVVVGRREEG